MTELAPTLEVSDTAEAAAQRGALAIADRLREAVVARGRGTLAVSGGRTPAAMFRLLAAEDLPWERIDLFQVDERVAPAGDRDRNASGIARAFVARGTLAAERCHWMPVETADLDIAARDYERALVAAAGAPPVLDVVHLGLGDDGHTASLFPGGAAVDATADVAVTGVHAGRRRMTLTLPILNRSRAIVWLVCGRDKQDALAALVRGDSAIVASRVRRTGALIVADAQAAAILGPRDPRPPARAIDGE